MLLERLGVFLLDRRATLVGLARLVRVLGIRRPEGADRLGVGGIEGLDEVVGRSADRLFVGLVSDLGRGIPRFGWCSRRFGGRAGRLGGDNEALPHDRGKCCPKEQARPENESNLLRRLLHG